MSSGLATVGRCAEEGLETAASLVTIVVADDEILERRLLAALEGNRPGLCAPAGSIDDVRDGSSENAPGVAVVARRSVPEALDALRRLRERRLRVVVVIADATPVQVRELFAAGADGLVLEPAVELALAATVDAVSCGQLVLPRTRRAHIAPPPLSAREKQVLGLVVLGLSNGEVAGKLHVAETTVKSHLTSSFRKLGVRSRSEATARLLDPHDGFGLGILSIAETDVSLDVFDAT